MSKRGDNIHKRKDGRWEGRIKVGSYPNGKTKYRSLYGASYKEVKEKMVSFGDGSISIKPPGSGKTLEELLVLWLQNGEVSRKGSTNLKYQYMIERHIVPCIGKQKLSSITSHKINTFLDNKLKTGRLDGKGGLSPSYVKTMALILQAAFDYGKSEKISPDISITISKPDTGKEELRILDKQEQKTLEAHLANDIDSTKIGTMISLHTGLRIGEICALSWDDIDLKNNIIHVRHTISRVKKDDNNAEFGTALIIDSPKTKSSFRDIPISSSLRPYLLLFEKQKTSEYVVSDDEGYLSPRTFDYRYHRLLNECGIESLNYHALRHTFATRCIEVGVDIKTLSELLGHSSVTITLNTYVHSSIELKRIQIEKLCTMAV